MKSQVAGILDKGGGFRVVITQPGQFHHHVGPGERLFVIPDLMVEEPVTDSGEIADLVERVRIYIALNRW